MKYIITILMTLIMCIDGYATDNDRIRTREKCVEYVKNHKLRCNRTGYDNLITCICGKNKQEFQALRIMSYKECMEWAGPKKSTILANCGNNPAEYNRNARP